MDATVIWTAVGAIGTLAAAGVAAWAARQSRKSAQQANAAASTLAAIERNRRHEELTPNFELFFEKFGGNRGYLSVDLAPGRLEYLDEVILTILDEAGPDEWAHGLPDGVTQEEAEAFVSGPYEFNTGASDQVVSNRQSRPRRYSRLDGKNWGVLSLRRTRPGRWMTSVTPDQWRDYYDGKPIRIQIICHRDGYDPWMLLHHVDIPVTSD